MNSDMTRLGCCRNLPILISAVKGGPIRITAYVSAFYDTRICRVTNPYCLSFFMSKLDMVADLLSYGVIP